MGQAGWPGGPGRLRAPWDPVAGRYRAPDEKTIRVVLDRLDPRALAGTLLGRPDGRPRPGRRPPASVRGYRARRAARQAQELARGRLRAVAVDGKTCRGARSPDGTRGCLPGIAEHGGHLPDHLEVAVKHNETSHFTELLRPVDLDGAVVTSGALHTVRANLDWLVTDRKAHYIAVVKRNQPLLHAQVRALPWRQVPAGRATRERGHGRAGTRTLKAAHVSGLDFRRPPGHQDHPVAAGYRYRQGLPPGRLRRHQLDQQLRHRQRPGPPGPRAVVHRGAPPHPFAGSFGEDVAASRTGSGPVNLATIRAAIIAAIRRRLPAHLRRPTRPHRPRRNAPPSRT